MLAEYSGVPVFNGLTDDFHPTQMLADLMNLRGFTHKHLSGTAICFMGDVGNNMGSSRMVGAALIGMDVRLCGPQSCWPDPDLVTRCRTIAETCGSRITLTEKHAEGLEGVDFVYSDAWVLHGQPFGRHASRMFPICVGKGKGETSPLRSRCAVFRPCRQHGDAQTMDSVRSPR